jgi:hypothetical protein
MEPKCDLHNICNTLIQTYNTSVLDSSNELFKEACTLEAKKCADETKHKRRYSLDRRVLAKLIVNHSKEADKTVPKEEKKPIATFIGGPKTLTMQWSKEYKKLIYIFGENHSENTDCDKFRLGGEFNEMLIEDYLDQLFKNSDVFIDFYLETGRQHKYIYGMQRMAVISERFKDCLYDPHSNYQKCMLSRMHYFDIRSSASDLTPNRMSDASSMLKLFLRVLKNKDKYDVNRFLVKYRYNTKIKPIIKEFSEIKTDKDYYEFWDKQINEHTFLNKKVIKSFMHEKIKSFIKQEIIDLHINITDLVKKVEESIAIVDKYKDETNDLYDLDSINESDYNVLLINLKYTGDELTRINSCIADYYLLCRIFKQFDLEMPVIFSSFRETDEPSEPHNIIIYAGEAHARRVRKFLKNELDFKMIDKKGYDIKTKANCIKMEDFPQPFFSNHPKVNWN